MIPDLPEDQIEIAGITYRVGPMSTMIQFHVVRKLAPLVARLPAILAALPDDTPKDGETRTGAELLDAAVASFDMGVVVKEVVDGLAELADKDAEFVVVQCMKTVSRRVDDGANAPRGGVGWTRVWNTHANQSQFQDIDLFVTMQLVFRCLMTFAAPFSSVLSSRRK